MACPGGCVNGGGQPIHHEENKHKNRIKAIYDFDNKDMIKVAHKNPQILQAYDKYYEKPGSEKCKQELYTRYSMKEVML